MPCQKVPPQPVSEAEGFLQPTLQPNPKHLSCLPLPLSPHIPPTNPLPQASPLFTKKITIASQMVFLLAWFLGCFCLQSQLWSVSQYTLHIFVDMFFLIPRPDLFSPQLAIFTSSHCFQRKARLLSPLDPAPACSPASPQPPSSSQFPVF